ncbi:DNA polymerase III subunit epsilon [Herbaspirillum sp. RTI4]|uniref:DNA polymerase III subunit epsilon n=1 Tax=Herbaspirillum sp. RTI4 TaxID=3048640 RepID=UPI002AB3651A|nr:DNA polymerase III subunit epsilon [Herbaspirillum sp. RTI4]MDY7579612.1 DNA polymerase III subunit epsilon [Herbaspirillum sp. RTI4]MEA9983554.1 DNA polymerase III subunit epsilon [Herbaspirillum sp. RTI4]
MRQIILDTETTGLNARSGDRIIEIGCVEMVNRQLTGNNFHRYINPERDSEEGALAVHGLTTAFLSDKPRFAEIAAEFREYLRDAEIVIHNAPFDLGFLEAEFALLGLPPFREHVASILDTLPMARELHPGRRNSLDALCDRYEISNAHRTLHGGLLDAALLAEVYLAMTRGQNSLGMELDDAPESDADGAIIELPPLAPVLVRLASAAEQQQHEAMLDSLDKESRGQCVWRKEVEVPAVAAS